MEARANDCLSAARRLVARDDLLQLALEAEGAVGIIGSRGDATRGASASEMFALAIDLNLQGARGAADLERAESPTSRGQFYANAASIARFGMFLDPDRRGLPDPTDLYDRSLTEMAPRRVGPRTGSLDREDLTLGVRATHLSIRSLRLDARLDEARERADQDDAYFHGSGAEQFRGAFAFESAACALALGATPSDPRRDDDAFWETPRAAGWGSRARHHLAQALTALLAADAGAAGEHLGRAVAHLEARESGDAWNTILRMSVLLAHADLLVLRESFAEAGAVVATVIELVEGLRSRWNVVARSRSPLAVAIRLLYGEVAATAARLGAFGARPGLRIAASAKQTGFATLLRSERVELDPRVRDILDDIVAYERGLWGDDRGRVRAEVRRLRRELFETVSPLFAELVLPQGTSVDDIVTALDGRCLLDVVKLPLIGLGAGEPTSAWFRTFVAPDGSVEFDRIDTTAVPELDEGGPDLLRTLRHDDPAWRRLGSALLPYGLRALLGRATRERPVSLVVSPHATLVLLPWAGLAVDDTGARLVERAVLTQVPAPSCLSPTGPRPVRGSALVRLVAAQASAPGGPARDGVRVDEEREVWGIDSVAGEIPLYRCELDGRAVPTRVGATFTEALMGREFAMVHVAAHGSGSGLMQEMTLPERLTAAEAMGLWWPEAVLLAVCNVGRPAHAPDAEPFGMSLAVLAGGARCVVGGIENVPDEATGRIAAAVIRWLRAGCSLDRALRRAQLEALHRPPRDWAFLTAHVGR